MPKYKFTIQTKNNVTLENITLISDDLKLAEARIAKMYPRSTILNCLEIDRLSKEVVTFDKVLDVISK
jgi:hypothetical protein